MSDAPKESAPEEALEATPSEEETPKETSGALEESIVEPAVIPPKAAPLSTSTSGKAQPRSSSGEGSFQVQGRAESKPAPRWLKIFFGVTGISLVMYLVKLVLRFVLGFRREGVLQIDQGKVLLKERTQFVGREVRASTETFARKDVLSVQFEKRYPYLLTLLGLLCLGIGVIAGVILLLDGIQGEFTPWIVSGVGLLMVGVVLDLVFTTLAASMPGQAALILHLPGKRTARLVGCKASEAERVVRWLEQPQA